MALDSVLPLEPALAERRTIADRIADAVRRAILSGDIGDGTELNQVELARHFNVSRVPVREAIRRLEAEGLVTAAPHRQAVAIGLTPGSLGEMTELRTLVETHLVRQTFRVVDQERIEQLSKLCDEMDDLTRRHLEWLARNRQFHAVLCGAPRGGIALALVLQLADRVEQFMAAQGRLRRVSLRDTGAEHRAIVAALERGNLTAATAALEQHNRNRAARVLEQLQEREA